MAVTAARQLGPGRPSSPLSYERIAACYDATRGGRARGCQIATDLAPYLGPPGQILEIGVGTGVVARALLEAEWSPVGVDLSPGMLRSAFTRLGPVVAVGDAACLPITDVSLPVVLAVWVLHLVPDVPAVLAEIHRVLQPGGRLVVVTHNPPEDDAITSIVASLQALLGRLDSRQGQAAQLARLAPRAGLRMIRIGRCRPYAVSVAPIEMAEAITERPFSWLWGVAPAQWAAVVDPAIMGLRALAETVAVVPRRTIDDIVVLERPQL